MCDQCRSVVAAAGTYGPCVVHEAGCPNASVVNKCYECGNEIVTTRGVNKRVCDDCTYDEESEGL